MNKETENNISTRISILLIDNNVENSEELKNKIISIINSELLKENSYTDYDIEHPAGVFQ